MCSLFFFIYKHGSQGNLSTVRWRPGNCCAGYTLVELIITVLIMGILAAVAVPSYSRYIDKVRSSDVVSDIHGLERDISMYKGVSGELPESLSTVGMGNLKDRWGNLYQYHVITGSKDNEARKDRFLHPINSDYDLYSMGEDGKSVKPLTSKLSRDDIIRANDGLFVGLASDY